MGAGGCERKGGVPSRRVSFSLDAGGRVGSEKGGIPSGEVGDGATFSMGAGARWIRTHDAEGRRLSPPPPEAVLISFSDALPAAAVRTMLPRGKIRVVEGALELEQRRSLIREALDCGFSIAAAGSNVVEVEQ
ncbi:hypothetical protein ZWY2020_032363 [Hordeum vulgare]|nr:hypothetical protein ZWY2020_032363 [Hordeum vulgare]